MSRRSALTFALVLSSLTAAVTPNARAQGEPTTVTILRRTAVRTAPSAGASTIANVNPSTFAVTQFQVRSGFVRLLLSQIDRRSTASGYGFIDTTDVAVDSAATAPVTAQTVTPARVAAPAVVPIRPDTVIPTPRPPAVVPARRDTTMATRAEPVLPAAPTKPPGEITIRPDAPPPPPSAVDTPDLIFLKQGPLTAILQRPISQPMGKTRDSITVPAGFVADFTSIPRFLWTELSPVGEHHRAAIVHDYLYWFQPCEREEADNLLMIAMREANVSDLERGAIYAGVRITGADVWNANRAARDRGDFRTLPTGVKPSANESWTDFRARLARADIRGTPGRMPRQPYCDYGRSQRIP